MSKEPKLWHGWDREPEADDPMELRMIPVPGGDPLFMATCLVEEYARHCGHADLLRECIDGRTGQ